jgi:HEPN domain-containing protein
MLMAHDVISDYSGCRCCIINGLGAGFALGTQTVEKLLKAYIILLDITQNPRKFSHKVVDLAHKAEALDKNLDITKFYPLLDRLEQYFQARYHDNPNQPDRMDSREIVEIDKLVIFLNEHLPMPDEVKYRSGIYSQLFSSKERNLDASMFPNEIWLTVHNEAIANISDKLEKRYFEVLEHLYPKR